MSMSADHRSMPATSPRSARTMSALTGLILVGSSLAAAVVAGNAPRSVVAPTTSGGAPFDYGSDDVTRVAPVRPEFIADRLGDGFAVVAAGPTDSGPLDTATPQADESERLPSAVATPDKEFRCVDGRQTEDPLSPPCDDLVFAGDNGGSTWSGVAREEVRILVRIDGGEDIYVPPPAVRSTPDSGQTPADRYLDLGTPPAADEPIGIEALRDLQTYFNRRYQTYGRKLRFLVYFDDGFTHERDVAQSLAVENGLVTDPFAAVSLNRDAPFVDEYLKGLARRDIVAFDGWQYRSKRFFSEVPGMLWSYHASIDQQAELYASYVCQKMAGRTAVLAGDPVLKRSPRRLALLSTDNPSRRDYRELAARIRQLLGECGATIVEEATYRTNGEECRNLPHEQDDRDIRKARADLARFRAAGVTTILWPGCPTSAHPMAATLAGWLPEWVLIGDPHMAQAGIAGTVGGAGVAWHRHAIMVSTRAFQPPLWESRCWKALDEVRPDTEEPGARVYACSWFGALQQIVTGVQLAGPRLNPSTFAAGFKRLVIQSTSDPQVPSCIYTEGDYSCIKDGQVLRFDAGGSATAPTLLEGLSAQVFELPQSCWLAVEGGRRHLPGDWPAGNIDAQFGPADTCTFDQQHLPADALRIGRL